MLKDAQSSRRYRLAILVFANHGYLDTLIPMKTAVLRPTDKKEITAKEAASRSEKNAFCPECRQPVRLHMQRKPNGVPAHFEHLNRTRKCPRETRYRSD
jgi:hypothetical protein